MKTIEEMQEHVRYCEDKARSYEGADREGWLDLAASWRRMISIKEKAAGPRVVRVERKGSVALSEHTEPDDPADGGTIPKPR